jgi:hypothetical protein
MKDGIVFGRQKSKAENRARKAFRAISFILGAFVACWTPYQILALVEGLCAKAPCTNEHLYMFSYFLCYGAPRGRKAYIQWFAAWFHKGIVFDTAITTPVPYSLQHDTFHLGFGRPEPRLPVCVVASPIGVNHPQPLPPPT